MMLSGRFLWASSSGAIISSTIFTTSGGALFSFRTPGWVFAHSLSDWGSRVGKPIGREKVTPRSLATLSDSMILPRPIGWHKRFAETFPQVETKQTSSAYLRPVALAPSTIPKSSTLPLVAEIPRASNTDRSAQHISESVSQAAKARFPLMRQGKTFPFPKLLLAIGPSTTPVQKMDTSVLSQIHSGTLSWIEDESPVPAKAAEVKYISSVEYLSGSTA